MTNQASEDKIEEELQAIFDGYDGFIDHEYQGTAYDRTDAINAIKAIIRTEKLKLLAEVREEAFSGGLSFELDDGQIVIEVETDLQSIITKLEAEL